MVSQRVFIFFPQFLFGFLKKMITFADANPRRRALQNAFWLWEGALHHWKCVADALFLAVRT